MIEASIVPRRKNQGKNPSGKIRHYSWAWSIFHTFAEEFERANRIAVFCNLCRASLNNIKMASKFVVTHRFGESVLKFAQRLSAPRHLVRVT